jgi:hypothetical protein
MQHEIHLTLYTPQQAQLRSCSLKSPQTLIIMIIIVMKFCNLYLPEVEVVSWIVVTWLSLLMLTAVDDATIRIVGDRVTLSVPVITRATVL